MAVLTCLTAWGMGLDEAQERALAQHPGLEALEAAVRLAQGEALERRALDNPELRLGRNDLGILGGNTDVEVRIRPPRPWMHAARARAGRAWVDASQAEYEAAEALLSAQVRQQVHAWLWLDQELALLDEAVALAEQRLAAVDQLRRSAGATTLDWLEAEEDLADVQQRRHRRRREQASHGTALHHALGLADGEALSLTSPHWQRDAVPPLDGLLASADTAPSMQAAQAQRDAAQRDVAGERLAWIPWFNFVQGGVELPDGQVPTGQITVGIELPLVAPGTGPLRSAQARADQASAEARQARYQLEQVLAQVHQEATLAQEAWQTRQARAERIRQALTDAPSGPTAAEQQLHRVEAELAEAEAHRELVFWLDELYLHTGGP